MAKRKQKKKIKGIFLIILTISCLSISYKLFLKNNTNNNINFPIKEEIPIITGDETIDKLYLLAKEDKRILEIIANKEKYPEEILKSLARNIDMTNYVLNFENKKGTVSNTNIGETQKGEFPKLYQYDERWGYGIYGDNYLAINGCGPTVISMAIAGLRGINTISPFDVAKYANESGYYTTSGTSWSLFTTGIKKFGLIGKELSLSKNQILNELNKGHPIVCSMRPGDFTTKGHFILLVGTMNGKLKINDPNSKERSDQLWEYEKIEPQIKNLWVLQRDI